MAAAVGILFLLPAIDRKSFYFLREFGHFFTDFEYNCKRGFIIYWYGFPKDVFSRTLASEHPKLIWDIEGKGCFRRRKKQDPVQIENFFV
jgi:hypothetical protein